MEDLQKLATLVDHRNKIASQITAIIGRPALIGHLGEYIAASVFKIRLEESVTNKASDGVFTEGPHKGKSVNVKFYGRQEGILDIRLDAIPDVYLVMTGPRGTASNSKGATRLWHIDHVFLFDGPPLIDRLKARNVKIGVATSVASSFWKTSEIYPSNANSNLAISEEQRRMLQLFASQ